jgi:hypothetical protein
MAWEAYLQGKIRELSLLKGHLVHQEVFQLQTNTGTPGMMSHES